MIGKISKSHFLDDIYEHIAGAPVMKVIEKIIESFEYFEVRIIDSHFLFMTLR